VSDLSETSVGKTLSTARKKKRLRYKKLSSELNIDESYLIALEEDKFDLIPGGEAYVKGFLRAYAKKLDLNPDEIIEIYSSEKENVSKSQIGSLNPIEKEPYSIAHKYLLGLSLVFSLAFVYFIFIYEDEKKSNKKVAEINQDLVHEESFEKLTEQNFSQNQLINPDIAKVVTAGEEGMQLTEIPSSVLVEKDFSLAPEKNITSIKVYDDCWLEVFTEDERLLYVLSKSGEEYIFNEKRLKIIVGNFKNIEISFNDKMIKLGDYANKNNVSCIVLPAGDCSEFRTKNN
tara:strand:+ start:415 stop:1278 length:864 start_codon:yes stop_codon:yes gene_type:complete